VIAWVDVCAWLITLVEVVPRWRDTPFEPWLAVIAVFGIATAVMWLGRRRPWRPLVLSAAVLYLVWYASRLYVLEVEPLLAILPLHQAVSDAFYVIWSSPMGRLSHGEVIDALAELWRECVMPLLQIGMLAAASRRSS
jgi:hypothetical protein